MEGIILRDSDHLHILDSRYTPTSRFLIKQILNFYNKNMQLDPNGEGCCSQLDGSFQMKRNKHNELQIEDK